MAIPHQKMANISDDKRPNRKDQKIRLRKHPSQGIEK